MKPIKKITKHYGIANSKFTYEIAEAQLPKLKKTSHLVRQKQVLTNAN